MAFKGWPAEVIDFYVGLEADNSKQYWTAHKTVYEQSVRRPMEELLADLAPEFGEGKIFRPYRDVRFSADKSPYKTSIAATIGRDAYVHLSADSLGAGCGMYVMSPDQLERYREAVADDRSGEQLAGLVNKAARQGIEVSAHDRLKLVPRGFPKDHPRADLLKLKGLIAWREWPVEAWLQTSEPKTRLRSFYRAAAPLGEWLAKNVGDPR